MDEDRKSERKRKRFAARLKSSKGINCTETAGPNIVLCNAGQATGFRKENFMNLINELNLEIESPKFIAEKGETHSFVVFRSKDNALTFYNACHGKAKADDDGTPLYLNFVESDSVPSTEVICPHEEPKGLTLLENFITEDEEKQLIQLFDWTSEDANILKNRRVKHYGYEFRYGSNDVDLDNPLKEKIPLECDVLWKRLKEQGFHLQRPDQLTVNKYSPGHGIPSHVDKHSPFGSTILSLSLGSSVVMDWKHHSGKNVPVVLPARSMLVMEGEARYDWQHGIQHTTTDPVIESRTDEETQKTVKIITGETRQRQTRISLTFRWTRSGPCECGFKTLCDSGTTQTESELDDKLASKLEELHVHQVYEQIAGHFSSTRHTAWPRVVQFARDVTRGSILLDLGAGNGKNVLPRGDILQIAGERSAGLLSECAEHTRHVSTADCVRLDILYAGLRNECADAVICIAVIHHMSTRARRLQAISTIHRLLRPSGRALITVWAKDQSRSNYLSKNKVATENLQVIVNGVNLHIHENRTQFQHKDLLVPWKLKVKSDKSRKGSKSSKNNNKSSKGNNNLLNNMNSRETSECLESDNNTSTNDSNSPKSDNSSKSNDNLPKSDENSSKSDDNSSKSDDNSSKSDDNSSKNNSSLSKSENNSSKSDTKLSERNEVDKENTLLRFYHVFEEGELDNLCKEVGFEIESTFYEEGNWCVICKKGQ